MPQPPTITITGKSPPAFDLTMSDDALITFGPPVAPGALSFTDIGYMPIDQFTIGGVAQDLHGKFDGLFIQYSGTGTQYFSATGQPTGADYTKLHYDLVGYKGDAVFSHATDGTPTLTGGKNFTVIAQGDLLDGHLGFTSAGDIAGEVKATFQVGNQVTGTLDLAIRHAATDLFPTPTGFTLSQGMLQAAFLPN